MRAALAVLTERGLRGVTHRAIDRHAGLAEGTTSAYYRSRSALQRALARFVTDELGADVTSLAVRLAGDDLTEPHAVELVASQFSRWLREGSLVQARIELGLEATRDPELATTLRQGRERIVALVASMFVDRDLKSALPPSQQAEVMVAAYDGVLLAGLLKPAPERAIFLDVAVAEILRPLRES